MQFVMIFSLIIAVLSVMFALQNTAVVSLKFFIWTFESPLGLLLLIALTVGAIIISILTLPSWFKNKRIKSIHQKELGELEENLAKYRTDLIDTQNKNKDLRQKVLELEEAKENLEKAHQKTLQEINDLRNALSNAELTAEEAEVAKKEAIAARDEINVALKEMDLKIASSKKSAEEAAEITAKEPDTIDEPGMTTAEPIEIPEEALPSSAGNEEPDQPENSDTDSGTDEFPEEEKKKEKFNLW